MAQLARDVAGRRYALAILEIAREAGTADRSEPAVARLAALTPRPAPVRACLSHGRARDGTARGVASGRGGSRT